MVWYIRIFIIISITVDNNTNYYEQTKFSRFSKEMHFTDVDIGTDIVDIIIEPIQKNESGLKIKDFTKINFFLK